MFAPVDLRLGSVDWPCASVEFACNCTQSIMADEMTIRGYCPEEGIFINLFAQVGSE